MDDYKLISSKTLFENKAVKIILDTLECQRLQRQYFYLSSPVKAVATVVLTHDNEIILTRQYRHPVRQVIYDLPAGHLEPGESPVEGAIREFEEETGYYPNHIETLGYYNQFSGTLQAATNLFFATNLIATQQRLDEGEVLEIVFKPVHEVLDMIMKNKMIDGSLQLGVLLAVQKGLLPVIVSE